MTIRLRHVARSVVPRGEPRSFGAQQLKESFRISRRCEHQLPAKLVEHKRLEGGGPPSQAGLRKSNSLTSPGSH
jgi:hypothetical protein